MELNIYNTELEFLGIVEVITSLLWVRKFFTFGRFQLTAPAIPENIRLLKKRMLVEKPGSAEIGYITSVSINSDVEQGEVIEVSGFFLSGLFSRRVIYDAKEGDNLLDVIDKQVGSMCLNPAKRINGLVIDKSVPVKSEFTAGQKFYNLTEYCKAVCSMELCGLCVSLARGNIHDEKPYLLLTVRYGVDRSIEQTENPQVVFSHEFDNLLSSEYQYSEDTAANTVYGYATAADDVDGVPPEYLIGDENSGYDRMETSISVNAVTESYEIEVYAGPDINGVPIYVTEKRKRINQAETMKLLELETANAIREISENMSGGVFFDGGYKTDYDLGDVVTVHDPKWGITLNQRVYEVTEYYDANGIKIEPIFGSPLRTIADFIDTT